MFMDAFRLKKSPSGATPGAVTSTYKSYYVRGRFFQSSCIGENQWGGKESGGAEVIANMYGSLDQRRPPLEKSPWGQALQKKAGRKLWGRVRAIRYGRILKSIRLLPGDEGQHPHKKKTPHKRQEEGGKSTTHAVVRQGARRFRMKHKYLS